MYGSNSGKTEYTIKIGLKHLSIVLAQNLTQFTSNDSSNIFSVWFELPRQAEEGTFKHGSAISTVMTELQRRKVMFQHSLDNANGTGAHRGQTSELIFYALCSKSYSSTAMMHIKEFFNFAAKLYSSIECCATYLPAKAMGCYWI